MINLGQKILAKIDGKIEICRVSNLGEEDIELELNEKKYSRKYWEIRIIKGTTYEEKED
jgi:hypothetical protein